MTQRTPDTDVTTDSGISFGMVLGVILAVVVAGAVLWYLFIGTGTVNDGDVVPGNPTTDVRPPTTNMNPPAQP